MARLLRDLARQEVELARLRGLAQGSRGYSPAPEPRGSSKERNRAALQAIFEANRLMREELSSLPRVVPRAE